MNGTINLILLFEINYDRSTQLELWQVMNALMRVERYT